jgi:hypothetical protein
MEKGRGKMCDVLCVGRIKIPSRIRQSEGGFH